jgi:hypothetical protein
LGRRGDRNTRLIRINDASTVMGTYRGKRTTGQTFVEFGIWK